LCKHRDEAANYSAVTFLKNRLRVGPLYLAPMCEIDASVVQAQFDCVLWTRDQNEQALNVLMKMLADSWKRHGNFDRADQLYAKAYVLSGITKPDGIWIGAVLESWADLKVKTGEAEAARKFAREHTELARTQYAKGMFPDTQTGAPFITGVVYALRFEADILERLGFDGEARALREEAESLSSAPERCDGVCGG
jgi:ATP/maltotriose-dependent transcriptional regulator MalT